MSEFKNKRLIIIGGPTASGKSSLAIDIAKKEDGVIINGDSMQIYSDIRILTARPSIKDEQKIPHKLYGFLKGSYLDTSFSVTKWIELALVEIKKCWSEGKVPIVVGGTGFYLKALIEGLSPIPKISDKIRNMVRKKGDTLSNEELWNELKIIDGVIAEKLNVNDKQRVLRALEVYNETGKPLSYWQGLENKKYLPDDVNIKVILKMPEKELLHKKIEKRFLQMIEIGTVDEVKEFVYNGYNEKSPVLNTLGLKEIIEYLDDKISLEQAIERGVTVTKQYAKRQVTWFKSQIKADEIIF